MKSIALKISMGSVLLAVARGQMIVLSCGVVEVRVRKNLSLLAFLSPCDHALSVRTRQSWLILSLALPPRPQTSPAP
jgi:hypothetical protein